MATNYQQKGHIINHTATADITSGSVVVIGNIIGVAIADIANGTTGAVAIDGVFEVPKVNGAVFSQGESLVFKNGSQKFDDNQASLVSGDVSGPSAVAFAAGANGEDVAIVKLTGVPGTVTA